MGQDGSARRRNGRTPVRPRSTWRTEWPLLLVLVLVWGAVWRDFSVGNLLFGLLVAVVLVKVFYLPPVPLPGPFRPGAALVFLGLFLFWIAEGACQVLWLAVRPGPPPQSAVLGVRLRSSHDLLITAVSQTVALIPGSVVVDVDRRSGTIYFHVIDISEAAQAEAFRDRVLRIEALVIRVMGSKEQQALREEEG